MAVNRYVDTSATYNGDGTDAAQASADGGVGAYNNIADALAAAPDSPAPGDEWDIWLRPLGSNISIGSILSPTNDGSPSAPHRLIGWPHSESHNYTVDSVNSGIDNLGFNYNTWAFTDSELGSADRYWIAATVTFTSGLNKGISRMAIWYDGTATLGPLALANTVYLDFPLPFAISAGDTYTINLTTEEFSNRPQSGIDAGWDSDTNIRPVLDGGGGSFNLSGFYNYTWWEVLNLELTNIGTGHSLINAPPAKGKNLLLNNSDLFFSGGSYYSPERLIFEKLFFFNQTGTGLKYGFIHNLNTNTIFKNSHFLGNPGTGGAGYGYCFYKSSGIFRLQNVSLGRVAKLNEGISNNVSSPIRFEGENVLIDANNEVSNGVKAYNDFPAVSFSSYNGEGFHQWNGNGELIELNENATYDPPSGASKYFKMIPGATLDVKTGLTHEESRYQTAGAKTYTWKFQPVGWTGLTTSDIELTAWYLDEVSGPHRVEVSANPSSVSNGAWHDLSVTVNPTQAGVIYFELKLKHYESGCWIALDPEPQGV